ncbi:hypothetical protein [Paraburkholderia caledonica]|uniref:DUF2335 domain-containing protein n=1 Tax=Paraburkholderia caledonica TaxID=134536 RepID=A0ABU1KZ63_9BURK|nr:hypothetical protein [Paraburkholderia caledonica]MDR6376192.1 hypothetical protein [Paraburkholderia caledonica]
MEIIEIFVTYPSGLKIQDHATFVRDLDHVYVPQRLEQILCRSLVAEAPPEISAGIDGARLALEQETDGHFIVIRPGQPCEGDLSLPGLLGRRVATGTHQHQMHGVLQSLALLAFTAAVAVGCLTPVWNVLSFSILANLLIVSASLRLIGSWLGRGEK